MTPDDTTPTPGAPTSLQSALQAALQRLGSELNAQWPPAALQQRVLDALGTVHANGPAMQAAPAPLPAATTPARWRRALYALATWGSASAFATFVAAFAIGALWVPARQVPAPVNGTAFVPVVPPQRLAQLARQPLEAGPPWIVSAEMPRERLAAFGLPFDPTRAGEPVRAELLLHPAGEVLAVRIVH
jgi:hypothetical protein